MRRWTNISANSGNECHCSLAGDHCTCTEQASHPIVQVILKEQGPGSDSLDENRDETSSRFHRKASKFVGGGCCDVDLRRLRTPRTCKAMALAQGDASVDGAITLDMGSGEMWGNDP